MEGWICLHRKILRWEWYHDTNTFRVFMHLLLNANWEETKYMGMIVKRGSLIMKQKEIGEQLGISHQQIRTAINKLKTSNVIEVKSTNRYTLVTVVNYSDYQDKSIKKQQTNNNQITHKQQSNNKQITRIDKQYKQYNNIYIKRDKNNTNLFVCQEKNFIKNYLNNINPTASPLELEKLSSWAEDLEPKLINRAIEIAVDNNARTYSYINAILNNWLKENIKTLAQYEAKQKIKRGEKQHKKQEEIVPTYNTPKEEYDRILEGF